MSTRWIIGLSSGSSLDGVEAALVDVAGVGLEMRPRLAHFCHQDYPRDLRDLILRVCGPEDLPAGEPSSSGQAREQPARQIGLLHRLLGETFAVAVRNLAGQARISLQTVQCLGFPGLTVWHDSEGRFPSSLGLGMAAVVAEHTGLTTVSDFRTRDLVVGGQGFPLTAAVDYLLFQNPTEHRVLIHLGGLATLVFLPAAGSVRTVLGFQAGPCSQLLDGFMRRLTKGREPFDSGGKHAVQGCCIEPLLERWLAHPVLQRRPPKCIPSQAFGEKFISQAVAQAQENQWTPRDLLCTATHFVARGITSGIRRFLPVPPQRLLLSGGGVRNGFLWHLIEQQFPGVKVEKTGAHGIPAQTRKAVAAAGLAALTLDCVPGNFPAVTGARGGRLLGSITPGSSANWARCLAWMAEQVPAMSLAVAG